MLSVSLGKWWKRSAGNATHALTEKRSQGQNLPQT